MAVSKEIKDFCAHNLVAMIINDIKKNMPDTDELKLLADFTSSVTYADLFREETGLWAEGPDYIARMYFEEKGIDFSGGI